jgi:hypothetical protein
VFGLVLDYDMSNVEALLEDYSEKLVAAEKLHRLGVPFNRINEVLELEVGEIEGGETGFIAAGLQPLTVPADGLEVDGAMTLQDVQGTALNGAQIASVREIAQAVSNGVLPADTAIELILVSFPTVDREQAQRIIGPAANFEPRVEELMGLDPETLKRIAYG